ncbi:hypothetical protein AGIG_G14559 [Arapaima gigas]
MNTCIGQTLEKLSEDELSSFKWKLNEKDGFGMGQLENMTRVELADHICHKLVPKDAEKMVSDTLKALKLNRISKDFLTASRQLLDMMAVTWLEQETSWIKTSSTAQSVWIY